MEIQFGFYTFNVLIAEIMHFPQDRHPGLVLICHGTRPQLAKYFMRGRTRKQ